MRQQLMWLGLRHVNFKVLPRHIPLMVLCVRYVCVCLRVCVYYVAGTAPCQLQGLATAYSSMVLWCVCVSLSVCVCVMWLELRHVNFKVLSF